MELDLHGMYVEDAIATLEKVIYSGESISILVIHGKGDGILRREIRSLLEDNKCVSEVRCGEDYNIPGGDGVTVIYT